MKPYSKSPPKFSNISDALNELGFILCANKSNNKHNGYYVLNQEGNDYFRKKYKTLNEIREDIDCKEFVKHKLNAEETKNERRRNNF